MWAYRNANSLDVTCVQKSFLRYSWICRLRAGPAGKACHEGQTSSAVHTHKRYADNFVVGASSDKASSDADSSFRLRSARPKTKKPAKGADLTSRARLKGQEDSSSSAHVTPSKLLSTPAAEHPINGGHPPSSISTASGTTPTPPSPQATGKHQPLAVQIAKLNPDDLVSTLKAGRYAPATHPNPRTSIPRPDTATGEVTHITQELLLATCREVRRHLLLDRSFQPSHIVELIELLAAHCGDREGREGAGAAGDLLTSHRGCSQALQVAQRSPEQAELSRLLPRLVPALVALEYDGKGVWESIFRVMHSAMDSYTGNEVAALVPALVELDSVIVSSGGSSSTSSSSSGSSTGFGSQQLQQPATSRRLQVLARDGGATGDATAGLLLWLVASSLKLVEMDQVTALIRRAMLRDDLSPSGCCHLLRATAWLCDRAAGSTTEVMAQLSRYEANLIPHLAQRLADHAEAGRLRVHEFTDAAQSFTRLRFLQPSFVAELAASTVRGIRTGAVKRRDISVALYSCAFFGCQEAAVTDLFAAAATALESSLGSEDLKPVILTRLAWSYSVAGGCGLLPRRRADRERVDRFVQKLAAALEARSKKGEVRVSAETWGQLRFALQIWSVLEPHLARPALLETVNLSQANQVRRDAGHKHGRQDGQRQQRQQKQEEVQPQQPQLSQQQPSASSPPTQASSSPLLLDQPASDSNDKNSSSSSMDCGGDGSSSRKEAAGRAGGECPPMAVETAAWIQTRISELQRDVCRQLVQLGYKPRMEGQVGRWTVDILVWLHNRHVGMEVDGPTHFTTSHPRLPLGTSIVRDACLRRLGLAVVDLCFEDYQRVKPAERGEYLRSRMEEAVGQLGGGGGGGDGGGNGDGEEVEKNPAGLGSVAAEARRSVKPRGGKGVRGRGDLGLKRGIGR